MLQVVGDGSEFRIHAYDPARDGPVAILKLLSRVRRARYDAVIDFESLSLLPAAFLWMARIPIRAGFNPPVQNPRARLFTHVVDMDPSGSMYANFVSLVRLFEPRIAPSPGLVPLPCAAAQEKWIEEWWQRRIAPLGARAVALHLGTGPRGVFRRWPVPRFVDLAYRLAAELPDPVIVLTGTRDDAPLIQEFIASYTKPIVDASDVGSLERTASLLKRCTLLVANDTGLMHVGAAMGTPTVGLFGPNTPVHWGPVGAHTAAIAVRLPCSPCIDTFRGKMPMRCTNEIKGQCMLSISVEQVLAAARRLLQEQEGPRKAQETLRRTTTDFPREKRGREGP